MPKTLDQLSTVRLDILSEEDVPRLIQWLEDEVKMYVVYKEYGDETGKPHAQGYVSIGDVDYKTLKASFHELFATTHKPTQRSFKQVVKVERYMRYVAKDKCLIKAKGVTEEHIKKMEDESYKKEKKKQTVTQVYVDMAYATIGPFESMDNVWEYKRKVVKMIVADAKGKKPISVYKIAEMAQSVMAHMSESYESYLVDQITSKMV